MCFCFLKKVHTEKYKIESQGYVSQLRLHLETLCFFARLPSQPGLKKQKRKLKGKKKICNNKNQKQNSNFLV